MLQNGGSPFFCVNGNEKAEPEKHVIIFQKNRTCDVRKPLYTVKGGFEGVHGLRRTI